jgi:hypothetical protein
MVTADAIARASIDAGDQRRPSSDPFPFSCSILKTNAEEENANQIDSGLIKLTLSGDETHVDLNNNNCTVSDCNDYEYSTKSSVSDDEESVDAEIDQNAAELSLECSHQIQQWLEKRLKHGFTIEEREAYVR